MQAVFRLKRNASHCIRDFVTGASRDSILTVEPSETARSRQPQAELRPCRLRLVKYTAGQTACTLGTTLLDAARYPAADLAALYHGRWSVEELYKVSKQLLQIESFHGRSERTVKQEVYAHFTLVALSRLFATECEQELAAVAAQRAGRRSGRTSTTAWARWRGSWKGCSSTMPRCCGRRSTGCWRTWPAARSGSGRTAPTRAGPSGHPRNGGIASQPTPTPQTDLRLPLGRLKRMPLGTARGGASAVTSCGLKRTARTGSRRGTPAIGCRCAATRT